MTSRERMVTTLNHQEPDRVPFDLGSTVVSGIQPKAYGGLLALRGEGDRELLPLLDIIQQLTTPHPDVLDRLGVDTLSLAQHVGRTDVDSTMDHVAQNDEYLWLYDVWGIAWHMPKQGGLYFDMYDHPLQGATLEDAKKFPWPDPTTIQDFEQMAETAKRLYEETDKAVIVDSFSSGILELYQWLFGYEDAYINLLADEALVDYVMDKILEVKIAYTEAVLPQVGQYCQIYFAADDWGHQNGPALSPEMIERFLMPRHRQHHRIVKQLAPHIKILFHTCGSVYEVMDSLIEAGIDILNPVQVSAADMDDTARLKREFGDAISFWGAIDTQEILPHGTPQEVKDEVKRRIDDLAPGGGYVLGAVHNIQDDVPPENIMAMVEALDEYGWYQEG